MSLDDVKHRSGDEASVAVKEAAELFRHCEARSAEAIHSLSWPGKSAKRVFLIDLAIHQTKTAGREARRFHRVLLYQPIGRTESLVACDPDPQSCPLSALAAPNNQGITASSIVSIVDNIGKFILRLKMMVVIRDTEMKVFDS